MRAAMTHEEATQELSGLSLDVLDAIDRAAVLAHVVGCTLCTAELARLRRDAAQLLYVVDPLPMSDAQRERIRARLHERVEAQKRSTPPIAVAVDDADVIPLDRARAVRSDVGRSSRGGVPGWMALAAGIVAVASVGLLMRERASRRDLVASVQESQGERARSVAAADSLRGVVEDRDRLLAQLTGAQVQVVTLASTGTQAPSARMFWDQSVNAWTFVAHGLPQPKLGRCYQLWLVTPSAKISAGVFAPDATGDALVRATYELPAGSLAAVAVTDEPVAGSAQPTTVPIIVGTTTL